MVRITEAAVTEPSPLVGSVSIFRVRHNRMEGQKCDLDELSTAQSYAQAFQERDDSTLGEACRHTVDTTIHHA